MILKKLYNKVLHRLTAPQGSISGRPTDRFRNFLTYSDEIIKGLEGSLTLDSIGEVDAAGLGLRASYHAINELIEDAKNEKWPSHYIGLFDGIRQVMDKICDNYTQWVSPTIGEAA